MNDDSVKDRDPQSILDETRDFWRETARDTVKGSAATIDETAKQVIGVVGIMEGLYFHAITYSNLRGDVKSIWALLAYLLPLFLWLLSLFCASLVFFPRVYQININSSEAAKILHEDTIKRKYSYLMLALGLTVFGALGLIIALGMYLTN